MSMARIASSAVCSGKFYRTSTLVLILSATGFADSVAGLKWTAPAAWKNEGSRPMRAATYRVPAVQGDSEGGECVAFFFGAGQGGSVDANIQRWIGQFQNAGKPVQKKTTMNGLPVTSVDITGTYTGMGGPMAASKTAKPGYRLLGAIVEGPGGSVFFKFTGPAKTVAANQKAFDQMIASVRKE
jgi:hypothetical protein